jgi:transketolase
MHDGWMSNRTTIGYGSAKEGTEAVHGNPLGEKDLLQVKKRFGFDEKKPFFIPQTTYDYYGAAKTRGQDLEAKWGANLTEYGRHYPKEASELRRRLAGQLPDGWKAKMPRYTPKDKALATR